MTDEKTPEPVVTAGALQGAVQGLLVALIGLLVAFGAWHPTDAQIGALLTFLGAVIGLIALLWSLRTRQKVTPFDLATEVDLDELGQFEWAGAPGVEVDDGAEDLHALEAHGAP